MRAAHRLILHSKNSGLPHTIPMKLSGTCGSVSVRLIPAPRGTGLVAAPASKKILAMAGLEDCYSTTRGHSRTTGNFITAVFNAVSASYGSVHKSNHVGESRKLTGRFARRYGYLSPELWKPTARAGVVILFYGRRRSSRVENFTHSSFST